MKRRVKNDILFEGGVKINDIVYSPKECSYLAVGTSRGDLYFLNVELGYKLHKAVKGLFSTPIKNIDWDRESRYVQIVSKTIEYGFADVEKGRVVDGRLNIITNFTS